MTTEHIAKVKLILLGSMESSALGLLDRSERRIEIVVESRDSALSEARCRLLRLGAHD